jgi:hypothetical protein
MKAITQDHLLTISDETIVANSQNGNVDIGCIEVQFHRIKNVVQSGSKHKGFKLAQHRLTEKQVKGQALSLESR